MCEIEGSGHEWREGNSTTATIQPNSTGKHQWRWRSNFGDDPNFNLCWIPKKERKKRQIGMKENSVFFFNSSVIVSVTVIIGDGDGGPNFDLRGCSCTGDFSPETLIQTRSFKTKRKVPPTTIQISILFLYWRRLRPQSNFSNVIQTRKKRCTSVCPTARAPKIPKSRVGKIPTLFL